MGGVRHGTALPDTQPHAPSDVPSNLAERVAAALVGDQHTELSACLRTWVADHAGYEASVRSTADGRLVAGRMMIEQAAPPVVDAIARALGVAVPPAAEQWLALAGHERLPIIAGWDRRGGGTQRCLKLYINASDASVHVRERVCAAAGVALPSGHEPPAVIGMNASADGAVELKLYVQARDVVALAGPHGTAARGLAAAAREERADAGGVLSFDLEAGAPRPRALFVALREPPGSLPWRCVQALPGYDAALVESLLPFPPAAPRSMGVSLSGGGWTLYCKPRGSGRAPEALEPVAVFRGHGVEVGVFIEPTEHAARAFRRTERHAVSVRVRAGVAPPPRALDDLVDWVATCLRVAERTGEAVADRLQAPPRPWCLADATPCRDADPERS